MKGVIFDMDGVLVDSTKCHIISWLEAFKNKELVVSEEALFLLEGMSYEETINYVSEKNNVSISDEEMQKIIDTKKKVFYDIFKLKTYEGLTDFVSLLKKQGFKLAVVTGSRKKFADKVLSCFFQELFDVVVTANDVEHGKPQPEPFLKAITLLGLEKKELIVIENAPLGIKSAKSAGLKVIALETTLDKKYLEEADLVLENHNALFDYFSGFITPRS